MYVRGFIGFYRALYRGSIKTRASILPLQAGVPPARVIMGSRSSILSLSKGRYSECGPECGEGY